MKIKSILLGSAAAMIAVSGAQAADAIIIEAEPMEYVKVCDMYGAGFFYIPGTETCMNINGYVRSTYTHGELDAKIEFKERSVTGGPVTSRSSYRTAENTSSWTVRGRLNFDVRNETEYGTLRSELRLQGGDADASSDQNVAIDRALIHLAGFRLGYSDTYWTTNHGYGAGSPAINDGLYGYDQAIFFDYTAQLMDGVSVTIGAQDSIGGSIGASSPDFYAGFNATFGNLTVAGTAVHESFSILSQSDDAWAYKVSAIMGLGESGWQIGGWYATDNGDLSRAVYDNSSLLVPFADTIWGVQVNGALANNFSVYGLYSKADFDFDNAGGFFGGIEGDSTTETIAIGAIWAPVDLLTVQFEYSMVDTDLDLRDGPDTIDGDISSNAFAIRVTRSF